MSDSDPSNSCGYQNDDFAGKLTLVNQTIEPISVFLLITSPHWRSRDEALLLAVESILHVEYLNLFLIYTEGLAHIFIYSVWLSPKKF